MHAHKTSDAAASRVTVIGIGADGWAGLTQPAREALRAAPVIAGPQRAVRGVWRVTRPLEPVLAAPRPGACVLALGRDRQTPAVAARLLTEAGWGASELTVLEQLGGPAERIPGPQPAARLTGTGFDDLCLLAVTPRPGAGPPAPTRTPGLPDGAYQTHREV